MSIVNRIAVLVVGYEFLPREVSFHGEGDFHWRAVPVCVYLLDTERGYILVDAGIDERKTRDQARSAHYFPRKPGFPHPLVAPEHEIPRQLAAAGLSPGSISEVILTHLHYDHTGLLERLPKIPVHVQSAEYRAALTKTPQEAYHPEDYRSLGTDRLRLHEGDTELYPGIELLLTPGHTEGHQSVLLTLRDGRRILLVGDVVDDRRNLREHILPGGMTDKMQAAASMGRVQHLIDDGAFGLFLHDAAQVREVRLWPGWV